MYLKMLLSYKDRSKKLPIHCYLLPSKTGNRPDMTEKLLTGTYRINTNKQFWGQHMRRTSDSLNDELALNCK